MRDACRSRVSSTIRSAAVSAAPSSTAPRTSRGRRAATYSSKSMLAPFRPQPYDVGARRSEVEERTRLVDVDVGLRLVCLAAAGRLRLVCRLLFLGLGLRRSRGLVGLVFGSSEASGSGSDSSAVGSSSLAATVAAWLRAAPGLRSESGSSASSWASTGSAGVGSGSLLAVGPAGSGAWMSNREPPWGISADGAAAGSFFGASAGSAGVGVGSSLASGSGSGSGSGLLASGRGRDVEQ